MAYKFRCKKGEFKKIYEEGKSYQNVLCNVLNEMDGLNVLKSSYNKGHMQIIFESYSDYSLSVLARAITEKYNTSLDGLYRIYLRSCDVIGEDEMGYVYILESNDNLDYETIFRKDINEITGAIRYWSKIQFKDHFNGKIKD